jgi:hypothetical protein
MAGSDSERKDVGFVWFTYLRKSLTPGREEKKETVLVGEVKC